MLKGFLIQLIIIFIMILLIFTSCSNNKNVNDDIVGNSVSFETAAQIAKDFYEIYDIKSIEIKHIESYKVKSSANPVYILVNGIDNNNRLAVVYVDANNEDNHFIEYTD